MLPLQTDKPESCGNLQILDIKAHGALSTLQLSNLQVMEPMIQRSYVVPKTRSLQACTLVLVKVQST